MESLFAREAPEVERRFVDFHFTGYRINQKNRRNRRVYLETIDGKSIEVLGKSRAMTLLSSTDLPLISAHRTGVELRRIKGEQWKIFSLGYPKSSDLTENFTFLR